MIGFSEKTLGQFEIVLVLSIISDPLGLLRRLFKSWKTAVIEDVKTADRNTLLASAKGWLLRVSPILHDGLSELCFDLVLPDELTHNKYNQTIGRVVWSNMHMLSSTLPAGKMASRHHYRDDRMYILSTRGL